MSKKSKIFKVTAATALLTSAALPVMAAEATTTYSGVVLKDAEGKLYSISKAEYELAVALGTLPAGASIEYVEVDGKPYSMGDYGLIVALGTTGDAAFAELVKTKEPVVDDNIKPGKFENGQLVPKEDETPSNPELKVESVSAINTTSVTVTISAPTADMGEATVEVKDAEGNVVEVKPTVIAAGDETATFEFATAVSESKLVGTWTVNGVAYDLDLINKIQDFLDADNQVKLLAALTALEIKDVNNDYLPDYEIKLQELQGAGITAQEYSVEEIQKLVDDVNAEKLSSTEEASLVEAIRVAVEAENQVNTLAALEAAGIALLNEEWVAVYIKGNNGLADSDGLEYEFNNNPDGVDTVEEIQTVISTLNDGKVTASIEALDANDSDDIIDVIDKATLTASKSLIETYASKDAEGNYTGDFSDKLKEINIQLALVDVLAATTPNVLKNKLNALAALDNTLDMTKYVDANGKDYIAKFKEKADTGNVKASEVNTLLDEVNAGVETSLVDAVYAAADAMVTSGTTTEAEQTALLEALQALGLEQVSATNKEQYATDAATFKTESTTTTNSGTKTKADVQNQVNASNITAITSATEEATLLAALKVLELDNIVDENIAAYLADVTGGAATIKTDATTIDAALAAINKKVEVAAAIKAINAAETATEVKTALDTLANNGKIADYLNVTSADRIFIAEQVLDARDGSTYQGDFDEQDDAVEVAAAVTAATGARTTAISGVNDLKSSAHTAPSDLTAVATALLAVGHDSLSGNSTPTASDTELAEKFINAVEFKEDGTIKTKFTSISAIRAVLDGLQ